MATDILKVYRFHLFDEEDGAESQRKWMTGERVHIPAISSSHCCLSLQQCSQMPTTHLFNDVLTITEIQTLQSRERREPCAYFLFLFLAYLSPEDQSAQLQVRGEGREANWWYLQLQRGIDRR